MLENNNVKNLKSTLPLLLSLSLFLRMFAKFFSLHVHLMRKNLTSLVIYFIIGLLLLFTLWVFFITCFILLLHEQFSLNWSTALISLASLHVLVAIVITLQLRYYLQQVRSPFSALFAIMAAFKKNA